MNVEHGIVIPSHVEFAVVEDKAIILDTNEGRSLELDEIGTRVWEAVDEIGDIEGVYQTLQAEYDVSADQLRREVSGFLGNLRELGLVEFAGQAV